MIQHQKMKKNNVPSNCSKCGRPFHQWEHLVKSQSLAKSLFKLQEEKCQWFSRELHDELGQWLTAVSAEAEVISSSQHVDSNIRGGAQSIKHSVKKMHDVIHNLMHELRPVLLDTLGLADSLHDLEEKWCLHNHGISCKFVVEGELNKFDEMTNITVYRIIQEALNNISKHAAATQVQIHVSQKLDVITGTNLLFLNIEDNGKGFNAELSPDGFGVLGMRERVVALDGRFNVYSAPGDGTQIHVKIPLNRIDISQYAK